MKYLIRIRRAEDLTILECIECTRQRFGKRDHDNIVSALTYWAASGCEFNHLVADVFVLNEGFTFASWAGCRVLRYETETIVNGSVIDMKLRVNGEYIRTINIAC